MKMMDNMMKGIIKGLPVEEREVLLLDMMPDMMKQVDMAKMMPGVLRELFGLLTLLSLYNFTKTLLKDDEAKTQLQNKLDQWIEKMPAMMEMMHPMMMSIMGTVMPKMMAFMTKMMPNMQEMMPQIMDESMIPMLNENPEVKEHMLGMMQTMFPHCAANLFPMIEKDKRIAFTKKLYGILARSASNDMEFNNTQSARE